MCLYYLVVLRIIHIFVAVFRIVGNVRTTHERKRLRHGVVGRLTDLSSSAYFVL